MKNSIIKNRRVVQAAIGGIVLIAAFYFHVSLLYILAIGAITGIIFGKIFCRWMCPLGFFMETMMGSSSDSKNQQLYNYHKLGCPIAWISGFLNRFSLFKIKRDNNLCIDCGKCDKVCYISSLNSEFSIYKDNKKNSATQYSCSKCLECVDVCPTKSLKYKI